MGDLGVGVGELVRFVYGSATICIGRVCKEGWLYIFVGREGWI